MKQPMKSFVVFLLATLVLLAIGHGPSIAEARECVSPSAKYHGMCMSEINCENVCVSEGFTGGTCHGFRRRCMCKKDCHGTSSGYPFGRASGDYSRGGGGSSGDYPSRGGGGGFSSGDYPSRGGGGGSSGYSSESGVVGGGSSGDES